MNGNTRQQTAWEETDEEVARRREQAQAEETGWLGTIVGLTLSFAVLVAITLS